MLNSVQEGDGFCSNNPLKKAISFGEWSGQPVLTNGKCPEIRSGTTFKWFNHFDRFCSCFEIDELLTRNKKKPFL